MKKILLIIIILATCLTQSPSPLKIVNTRSFQFTYSVDVESTGGEKLELWLPIPRSNEVQTISNLKLITNGLQHNIEDEKIAIHTYFRPQDSLSYYILNDNKSPPIFKLSDTCGYIKRSYK